MYLLRRNLIYVYAHKNIINLKISATSGAKFNISWKNKGNYVYQVVGTVEYCPHGFTKNANRPMRTGGGHGI